MTARDACGAQCTASSARTIGGIDPESDPRTLRATRRPGEPATRALEYLSTTGMTLEMKCEGLDAEQLPAGRVPPSTMSLLGLVRHLAKVEHSWFRRVAPRSTGTGSTGPPRTAT